MATEKIPNVIARSLSLEYTNGLHRLPLAEADRTWGARIHLRRSAGLVQSAVRAGTVRGTWLKYRSRELA